MQDDLYVISSLYPLTLLPCFVRDVRPKFECLLEKTQDHCLKAIKSDDADLTILEGGSVLRATKEFNATPIIVESYGPGSTDLGERPAIAVVQQSSSINKLGKKQQILMLVNGIEEGFFYTYLCRDLHSFHIYFFNVIWTSNWTYKNEYTYD